MVTAYRSYFKQRGGGGKGERLDEGRERRSQVPFTEMALSKVYLRTKKKQKCVFIFLNNLRNPKDN